MTYSDYLSGFFPGLKVQKISLNVGFSCPNRDGSVGTGGCIYCRNDSFTPSYCMNGDGITAQLEAGKRFFSRKYPSMKFLAYFQSYTNTHTADVGKLESMWNEALECEDVVGIVVGTRPDTLPAAVIDSLAAVNVRHPVFLEIGAETSHDRTLRFINRGHSWQDVCDAVERAAAAGLHCGLHLIAGLPGENDDDVILTVERACCLPVESLKFHQLQILKGTTLHEMWINGKADVHPYDLENYLSLCRRIKRMIPDNVVVERYISQAPPELVVAPKWGIKNYQFMNLLNKTL